MTAWSNAEAVATWWFDRAFWRKKSVVDVWVFLRLILTVFLLFSVHRFRSTVVVATALLLFENLWYNAGVVVKGGVPEGSLRLLTLAIVSYVSSALSFAVLYAAWPTSLKPPVGRFDAAYFSFVTSGTIGFGDIVPISQPIKAAAVAQHLVSLYYVALVLVVTVGLARKRIERAP